MKTTVGVMSLAFTAISALAQTPPGSDAKAGFEKLKALAGEWKGTTTTASGPPASVTFQVVSGGSVVEEIQFPGTPHEMRSLYHMDGRDLVLTHYCAMGNQPKMRLDLSKTQADSLVFDFTGGTNLDPASDTHVHSGRIKFLAADRIESEWFAYQGGKPAGSNLFLLQRARP